MIYKISIIGLGFVGSAIKNSLEIKKNDHSIDLYYYDKYKNGGIGKLEECLNFDIIFLCLPTQFDENLKEYDKTNIYEICDFLSKNNYNGTVIIKSTIEPETTNNLCIKYINLQFIHNPEFLTAKTAFEDFHNQKHIVLGKSKNCSENNFLNTLNFYKLFYPNAEISECTSLESESMKIFCNSFYAVKVQFFTELFLTCQKNGSNYKNIVNMMIKNSWINPMHTNVPGPDGNISYGGLCFPKDTNALLNYMKENNTPCSILENCIMERNKMRDDNLNIK